jgi:hypothetical protein
LVVRRFLPGLRATLITVRHVADVCALRGGSFAMGVVVRPIGHWVRSCENQRRKGNTSAIAESIARLGRIVEN